VSAFSLGRIGGPRARTKSGSQPIEYNLLLTATLCLLAFGVVMVFSASSTTALLGQSGDSAYYLKRTLVVGAMGLVLMRLLSARGARIMRPLTGVLLVASFGLLLAVMLPGIGNSANGAQRWIGAGPFQLQPSELAKLALVLYGANLLAIRPQITRSIRTLVPYLAVVGLGCLLMMAEPDLGTAIVVSLSTKPLPAEQVEPILWSSEYARLPEEERRRYHGIRDYRLWWGLFVGIVLAIYAWFIWFRFQHPVPMFHKP
jgi:cell division protein FtsW